MFVGAFQAKSVRAQYNNSAQKVDGNCDDDNNVDQNTHSTYLIDEENYLVRIESFKTEEKTSLKYKCSKKWLLQFAN